MCCELRVAGVIIVGCWDLGVDDFHAEGVDYEVEEDDEEEDDNDDGGESSDNSPETLLLLVSL